MPDTTLISEIPPAHDRDYLDRVIAWFKHPDAEIARAYPGASCNYRTPDGKQACGVGCAIPDTLITTLVPSGKHTFGVDRTVPNESTIADCYLSAGGLLDHSPEASKFFENVTPALLSKVQHYHDTSDEAGELVERLERLATDCGFRTADGFVPNNDAPLAVIL